MSGAYLVALVWSAVERKAFVAAVCMMGLLYFGVAWLGAA